MAQKKWIYNHIGLDPKILGSKAYGEGMFDTNFKNSKFGEWDGENNFGLFDTAKIFLKNPKNLFLLR